MRVLVVGAGVVGLTCAVRLAEDGHDVHVLARDLPAETVSAVAAAWWYPYLAEPREQVTAWAARSYVVLGGLAAEPGWRDSVAVRRSRELLLRPAPDPWWRDAVPGLERVVDPPAGYADGWSFDAPVVDMGAYLPLLVARLAAAGGTVTRAALSALPTGADLVVNAAGLGNRMLTGDRSVTPVRGQVVRVAPCGVEDVTLAEHPDGPVYVVPRAHDVVVGGTSQPGEWGLAPDPATARAVLARAAAVVPEVAGATVLAHRVGLRPARPRVRLEREERPGASPVIHCYGHGGAGVTLSWGCADEVAALASG